jgi:hypothetical protein
VSAEYLLRLLRERAGNKPCVVLHHPNLPKTPPEVIEAVQRTARFPIIHVRFVKGRDENGNYIFEE